MVLRYPGLHEVNRRADSSLDPELRLFRLKAFFRPVLIDKKLADEIKGAGFVGSYIQAPERYRF
jgi:hypothetical protein